MIFTKFFYLVQIYSHVTNVVIVIKDAICVVSDEFVKFHTFFIFVMICTFYILANCYKRVKDETTEFQEVIEKELGLKPIEQEVVVLYKGEKTKQPVEELWKVRLIDYTILLYY